ncbi:NHLP leader peptide domain protein [Kordia sp. SMS9]|uniref:class IIb bacteriocin, lactobin A/cerein 7B family n=1 Tax=Kordia sp. SMS9 TaxID=2282170 RepID=UPI000E0D60A5|nr:class IIb bacteriocin, lactobin A/cerein 7B family [Kordia sp. SMS9]AXG69008.1 NHLP leader peptide domain protein [Kordia sp. SMS9]
MGNTQNNGEKGQELMQELITRAWESETFKLQLVNDPKAAIESVTGKSFELPEGKRVVVQDQSDDNVVYINIPAKPNLDEMELTDEQLEKVAGGLVVSASIALVALGVAGFSAGIALYASVKN